MIIAYVCICTYYKKWVGTYVETVMNVHIHIISTHIHTAVLWLAVEIVRLINLWSIENTTYFKFVMWKLVYIHMYVCSVSIHLSTCTYYQLIRYVVIINQSILNHLWHRVFWLLQHFIVFIQLYAEIHMNKAPWNIGNKNVFLNGTLYVERSQSATAALWTHEKLIWKCWIGLQMRGTMTAAEELCIWYKQGCNGSHGIPKTTFKNWLSTWSCQAWSQPRAKTIFRQ